MMKTPIADDSRGNRHEPNAILQVLLDYLPSGVTLFGPDLEMIACNAKLRELLDFPDELFARGLPSLPTLARFNAMRGDYGPGDPEEMTAAAVERARTMKPHVFERTRLNGVVLEVRGNPLPGGGFVTIYTDITERKEAEKALALERDRLDLALTSANLAMWDADLRTGRVSLDERWARMLGEVPGARVTTTEDLLKLAPAHDRDRLLAAITDAASGRTSEYLVEQQVHTRNGEWRWIQSRGKVVERDAQGRALRLIGINSDITQHKQVEQELTAAKEGAERANAAKDTFLATMSHEIRTPLNGLLGALELLGLSRLDDEQRGMLVIAQDSGRGLVCIIDEILDFSKIEAGKLDLEQVPVTIAKIVESVSDTLAPIAHKKRVELITFCDPKIPETVGTDPVRLRQILFNL